jgi:hypothetical protein
MTDIDENLQETIAAIWVIWGGDSEGFEWSYRDILEKIKQKEGDSHAKRMPQVRRLPCKTDAPSARRYTKKIEALLLLGRWFYVSIVNSNKQMQTY